jgi:signal transduction histidine kinase
MKVMQRPHTIKASLLAGFLVIFAVWLGSTFYFTERLARAQAQSAAIHARYARGQDLLSALQSQVLLASIYVRDALLADQDSTAATAARDQLRALQLEVKQELEQYDAVELGTQRAAWGRLETEVQNYWDAAVRLVAPTFGDRAAVEARLRNEVIPRRDVIVTLSDELRQVMAENASIEQEQVGETNATLRRWIWGTTAVAAAIGVGIAVLSAWYVGRLEMSIRDDHAEISRKRQELRRLSGRLVSAQEDERRTIARELHDEIGQALTAVDVELAVAETAVGADGRAAGAIREARGIAQHALTGVRDLSQLLRPSMLDDFGLPDTLRWYLRKFSDRTGVQTELVEDRLSERLPIDVEVCVYRFIQEALTNVSRHAQARTCRIFVQRVASSVIVTVEDDGIGWRAPQAGDTTARNGLGLVGIRERVADLGGIFRIEGTAGKGTRLTIELPFVHGEVT